MWSHRIDINQNIIILCFALHSCGAVNDLILAWEYRSQILVWYLPIIQCYHVTASLCHLMTRNDVRPSTNYHRLWHTEEYKNLSLLTILVAYIVDGFKFLIDSCLIALFTWTFICQFSYQIRLERYREKRRIEYVFCSSNMIFFGLMLYL